MQTQANPYKVTEIETFILGINESKDSNLIILINFWICCKNNSKSKQTKLSKLPSSKTQKLLLFILSFPIYLTYLIIAHYINFFFGIEIT